MIKFHALLKNYEIFVKKKMTKFMRKNDEEWQNLWKKCIKFMQMFEHRKTFISSSINKQGWCNFDSWFDSPK